MHGVLGWSIRKATQAAFRKRRRWKTNATFIFPNALRVKENKPSELLATQSDSDHLRSGYRIHGRDRIKRVSVWMKKSGRLHFSVSVAADGTLLPFRRYTRAAQISHYQRKMHRTTNRCDHGWISRVVSHKNLLVKSETMQKFVNKSRTIRRCPQKLGLGLHQTRSAYGSCMSVRSIDRWVSRVDAKTPSRIIIVFVPGGCTGVHQPAMSVFSVLWIINSKGLTWRRRKELLAQLDAKTEVPKIDDRLGTIRDRHCKWFMECLFKRFQTRILQKGMSTHVLTLDNRTLNIGRHLNIASFAEWTCLTSAWSHSSQGSLTKFENQKPWNSGKELTHHAI